MKPHSVISLGAIIGQADNVMLSVMQSVPAHPNTQLHAFLTHISILSWQFSQRRTSLFVIMHFETDYGCKK